jgi:undecaprenyl-diphosphatase
VEFLDPEIVRAIILGIVQGITEFLPVSSSGHLVIVPYLLSWEDPGLAVNVALHAGTLVAVVAYFRADLWYLATRSVGAGVTDPGEAGRARRVIAILAVGTVPAAIAGAALGGAFERLFAQPVWVAGFLLVTAGLLTGAELLRRRRLRELVAAGDLEAEDPRDLDGLQIGRDETTVSWLDALLIGAAQAVALIPGISRSGATIAAGMALGLSRAAAARFSFLLAIPIIAGATVVEVPALFAADPAATTTAFGPAAVAAGMVAAAISGYWAIRFLLRLVQTTDLFGFVRYLVLVAVLVGIGRLWLGPPGVI